MARKRFTAALRLCGYGVLAVTAGFIASGCANGEVVAALYGGFPLPEDSDVTISGLGTLEADFDGEWTLGARGGCWGSLLPVIDLGLFLDVSGGVEQIEDEADLSMVPITILPMVRIPLFKSEERPHGAVQPYAGIGPSIVWSELDVGSFNDDTAEIGFDARAGVNVMLLRNLGVFLEYRFNYFEGSYSDLGGEIEADSNSHAVLLGVSVSL